MSDTWIEDWYDLKDARAELELAVQHCLDAGLTTSEIQDAVAAAIGLPNEPCPGYPNCRCGKNAQWSHENDPHGTFGPPGMMGG